MLKSLITNSLTYFRVEMVTLVLVFVNQVFIAFEKAKGNTKRIFKWNLMVMIIKLIASLFFVIIFNKGIIWLGIASIIAQSTLTIVAFGLFIKDSGIFGFDWQSIKIEKNTMAFIYLGITYFH